MAHDKKLNEAIALAVDLAAAKNGRTTVAELRKDLEVRYPPRKWHPFDQREANNDFLAKQILKVFKAPVSSKYLADHPKLQRIRAKDRLMLGKIPAWIFVRSINQWVFSLQATEDYWREGQTMRVDMAEVILAHSEEFAEKADLIATARVRNLFEYVTR